MRKQIGIVKAKIFKQYRKLNQTKLGIRIKSYQEFVNILIDIFIACKFTNFDGAIGLCITDTYLFLRLFSEFDKSKKARSPVGCSNMYSKNSIMYGGADHTTYLMRIISHFFGKATYIYENKSELEQCIELGEDIQFF
jgi:hypothetical protein